MYGVWGGWILFLYYITLTGIAYFVVLLELWELCGWFVVVTGLLEYYEDYEISEILKRKQYLPDAYVDKHLIVVIFKHIYCFARIVDILYYFISTNDGLELILDNIYEVSVYI